MWKILNGVEWKTPGHCNYTRIQLHRNLYSFFCFPWANDSIPSLSLSLKYKFFISHHSWGDTCAHDWRLWGIAYMRKVMEDISILLPFLSYLIYTIKILVALQGVCAKRGEGRRGGTGDVNPSTRWREKTSKREGPLLYGQLWGRWTGLYIVEAANFLQCMQWSLEVKSNLWGFMEIYFWFVVKTGSVSGLVVKDLRGAN